MRALDGDATTQWGISGEEIQARIAYLEAKDIGGAMAQDGKTTFEIATEERRLYGGREHVTEKRLTLDACGLSDQEIDRIRQEFMKLYDGCWEPGEILEEDLHMQGEAEL